MLDQGQCHGQPIQTATATISLATTANGITVNGITVNGITVNGITINGITINGIKATEEVAEMADSLEGLV